MVWRAGVDACVFGGFVFFFFPLGIRALRSAASLWRKQPLSYSVCLLSEGRLCFFVYVVLGDPCFYRSPPPPFNIIFFGNNKNTTTRTKEQRMMSALLPHAVIGWFFLQPSSGSSLSLHPSLPLPLPQWLIPAVCLMQPRGLYGLRCCKTSRLPPSPSCLNPLTLASPYAPTILRFQCPAP